MTDSLELFSARVCPYAHRSRLAMMEKGLDFQLTEIDLSNKPQRFLDVSAYGKVPALVHNEVEVYESAIINEYVDECFPDPPLLPADKGLRAAARIWIDFCNTRLVDHFYAVIRNVDQARRAELEELVYEDFRFIETHALDKLGGDGPYWFGDRPSLVDFAYYPHFERFPAWEYYRGLRVPQECPRLRRWVEAMSARDSVVAIANSAEYYIERYKGYAKAS